MPADYFEIAKSLTRAHSELAGKAYLKEIELDTAKSLVLVLADQVWHMAQVAHQAYHQEQPGAFTTCRKAFCQDAARVLSSIVAGEGAGGIVREIRKDRDQWEVWARELESMVHEAWDNKDATILEAVNAEITCPGCGDRKDHNRGGCVSCVAMDEQLAEDDERRRLEG